MTNYIPSPVKLPPRHFIFHFTIPFSNGKLLKRKDVQKSILLLRHSARFFSIPSFDSKRRDSNRQFPKLFPLIEFAPGSLSAIEEVEEFGDDRRRNASIGLIV